MREGTMYHVSLDVRGAIKWPKRLRAKLLLHDDGRRMSADEATDALLEALAAGCERLPIGDECDDHDPKTGCRGHLRPLIDAPSIARSAGGAPRASAPATGEP